MTTPRRAGSVWIVTLFVLCVCFQLGEGHDCTKESWECVDCDTICAVCFQLGE